MIEASATMAARSFVSGTSFQIFKPSRHMSIGAHSTVRQLLQGLERLVTWLPVLARTIVCARPVAVWRRMCVTVFEDAAFTFSGNDKRIRRKQHSTVST